MELVSASRMRQGLIKVAISIVISFGFYWPLSTTKILRYDMLLFISCAIGVSLTQIIDWRLLR